MAVCMFSIHIHRVGEIGRARLTQERGRQTPTRIQRVKRGERARAQERGGENEGSGTNATNLKCESQMMLLSNDDEAVEYKSAPAERTTSNGLLRVHL
jgi:hypothetical protein